MSDEEILKHLKASLRFEETVPVTEAEIQEFLAETDECPPGTVERVRAGLAQKVLSDLHPEPVRSLERNWSFGQWLKLIRQKAHLTRKDVAAAINKDQSLIEQLETEKAFPWHFGLDEIADLMGLFRVNMKAVNDLAVRSLDLSKARLQNQGDSLSSTTSLVRGMIGGKNRVASESSSANKFDLPELFTWLDDLKNELKRRQAKDLL
jgi:transcriptional regulator with XRE-family HTH domain